MPVAPSDKPLQTLREETVDQLIVNYARGKLSLEAFESRLDRALDATNHAVLLELTADLEIVADKAFADAKRRELGITVAEAPAEESTDIVNIFGGTTRSGGWVPGREIRMFNLFGGVDLDFTEARFAGPTVTVRMVCLFGGVDLFVSEDISTVSKLFCVFGGVDDKVGRSANPNAPTVIVKGLVIFGGVDVRIRKSFRERLIDFADSIRGMFGPTS